MCCIYSQGTKTHATFSIISVDTIGLDISSLILNQNKRQQSGVNLVKLHNEILVQQTAKKFMASVLWEAKRILSVDYLHIDNTINSLYDCNLLDQLDGKVHAKTWFAAKNHIFHQDNAPGHNTSLANAKFNE